MKKFLGNSILFTISGFVIQAVSFFLLPFYSTLLTTAEYGIINTTNTIIFLCNLIISLRLDGAISKFYFECKDEKEVRLLYTNLNVFLLKISTCGYGVLFFVAFIIFKNRNVEILIVFIIALLTRYFDNFFGMLIALLTAKQDAKKVSILTVLSGAGSVVLTYAFVTNMEQKMIGYVLSFLCISGIRMIYSVYYFIRNFEKDRQKKPMSQYINYSINFLPIEVAYWVINASDRVVISAISGVAAAGIYSMGSNLSQIINIFVDSMNKAYTPFMFSKLVCSEKSSNKMMISKTSELFRTIGVVISMGVLVFSPSVVRLLDSSYEGSSKIAVVLAVAMLFSAMSQTYNAVCNFYTECISKKVKIIILAAVINIMLNIVFVIFIGELGAAIATVICYLLILSGLKRIADEKYKIKTYVKREMIIWIISVCYACLVWINTDLSGLIIKIIVSGIYVLSILGIYLYWFAKEKGEYCCGKNIDK